MRTKHGGEVYVMSDNHNCEPIALRSASKQLEDAKLMGDIQGRCRFVQQHDRGGLRECRGEARPLTLPAGKSVEATIREFQRLRDAHGNFRARMIVGGFKQSKRSMWKSTHEHEIRDAEIKFGREALRNIGDSASSLAPAQVGKIAASAIDCSRSWRKEACEKSNQRALAGAVGTDDCPTLPRFNGERDRPKERRTTGVAESNIVNKKCHAVIVAALPRGAIGEKFCR